MASTAEGREIVMQYIAPRADLSAVDSRFEQLSPDRQWRVAELMLTVATLPMSLAIDAILETDKGESRATATCDARRNA